MDFVHLSINYHKRYYHILISYSKICVYIYIIYIKYILTVLVELLLLPPDALSRSEI